MQDKKVWSLNILPSWLDKITPILWILLIIFNFFISFGVRDLNPDFPLHNVWILESYVYGFSFYNLYHDFTALILHLSFGAISIETAVFLTVSIMRVLYTYGVYYFCRKYTNMSKFRIFFLTGVITIGASIPNFFSNRIMYDYATGLNIWHNPTTFTVMPFVVVTMFLFYKAICIIKEEETTLKQRIVASLFLCIMLLISVYGKGSWFPPMALGSGMYLFYYWASDRFSKKRFIDCLIIGFAFIPAGLYTLWLSTQTIYSVDLVIGITNYIRPVGVLLNMSLPIVTLVLLGKNRIKNNPLVLISWLVHISAILIGVFLIEYGRESHGNMTWGILYANIMLVMTSLIAVMDYIKSNPICIKTKIIFGLAFIHLGSGGLYAVMIVFTRQYIF